MKEHTHKDRMNNVYLRKLCLIFWHATSLRRKVELVIIQTDYAA